MLLGHLDQHQTYKPWLTHEIWQKCLQWIEKHRQKLPGDGIYELEGKELRVAVITKTPQAENPKGFEAHRQNIDFQIWLTGGEILGWAPISKLKERVAYNETKDTTLYEVPTNWTRLQMTPGSLAVFFPEDAHMPNILAQDKQVRKAVFKINLALLK